jgi:hypothetical protein
MSSRPRRRAQNETLRIRHVERGAARRRRETPCRRARRPTSRRRVGATCSETGSPPRHGTPTPLQVDRPNCVHHQRDLSHTWLRNAWSRESGRTEDSVDLAGVAGGDDREFGGAREVGAMDFVIVSAFFGVVVVCQALVGGELRSESAALANRSTSSIRARRTTRPTTMAPGRAPGSS